MDIEGLSALAPGASVILRVHRPDGREDHWRLQARIDTADELAWYRAGGIMHYVLAGLAS